MEGSQNYIGTPCGLVVCADRAEERTLSGRFYHFYSQEGQEFHSLDELVFRMEQFFDRINFPYPANRQRVFTKNGQKRGMRVERKKVMGEEELLAKHGDLGTFIVRVQHRQNSSWQGRITWSDKNQTVNFRSIWEMVRLIGDALDTVSEPEGNAGEVRWPEECGARPDKS